MGQLDYRLHYMGKDLGVFPLEELQRRRRSQELTGQEFVWREGMENWRTLDSVLAPMAAQNGPGLAPPPISSIKKTPNPSGKYLWMSVIGIILLVGSVILISNFTKGFVRGFNAARQRRLEQPGSEANGLKAASQPLVWNTNTLTQTDVQTKQKAFRVRQYLESYQKFGQRDPSYDADALLLLNSWINSNYSPDWKTNAAEARRLGDKLANNPRCNDPLILTVAAINSVEGFEANHRLERALRGFESSKYKAYPQLFATVFLANNLDGSKDASRVAQLDAAAVELFGQALEDGSILPEDQADLADSLVSTWGEYLFKRKGKALCLAASQSDETFHWLSLVLDGENEINEAWKARGGGYANTVTEQGWQGFNSHLAQARKSLGEAWQLRPDLPLASSRMMAVALGSSGANEMRLWFNRTVAAQIDYPAAWKDMRWGLRPRWYGSPEAMLAFGVTALNSGRFDTDVPRKFSEVVYDLELEDQVLPGQHIYGREDIWPQMQRMYEGYISAPSQTNSLNYWHSAYAVVAYFAGKYDVAHKQLEQLDWELQPENLVNWGTDLSLMSLEVAARTSPLAKEIKRAEQDRDENVSKALQIYKTLSAASNADERTRQFIQYRIASLEMEEQMQKGGWVDFLPAATNDLNWVIARGACKILPDGSVEVESGPTGHSLFCRARVGVDFEVKGEIEVVRSSDKSFQAGLVMGLPDPNDGNWFGFRLKRNGNEGENASYSYGWAAGSTWPVALNSGRNAFSFRRDGTGASATVNDRQVFAGAKNPTRIWVCDNQFLVGLGAYNDMNETVIRYREVKIRRIQK